MSWRAPSPPLTNRNWRGDTGEPRELVEAALAHTIPHQCRGRLRPKQHLRATPRHNASLEHVSGRGQRLTVCRTGITRVTNGFDWATLRRRPQDPTYRSRTMPSSSGAIHAPLGPKRSFAASLPSATAHVPWSRSRRGGSGRSDPARSPRCPLPGNGFHTPNSPTRNRPSVPPRTPPCRRSAHAIDSGVTSTRSNPRSRTDSVG